MKMPNELTNKELKKEIVMYDEMIHGENACFGTKDVTYYEMLLREAEHRGFKIKQTIEVN